MAIKNNAVGRDVFLVHDITERGFAVEIKSAFIPSLAITQTVTSIIKHKYVEPSFREALTKPAEVRNVSSIAVEVDDGRWLSRRFSFEIPAV